MQNHGQIYKTDTKTVCTRAVWRTADEEESSEQLILGSVKQLISCKNQNVGLGWE